MCAKEFQESCTAGKRQLKEKKYGKDSHCRKGINMHKLGEAFVGEVLKVREGKSREDGLGKGLEFLARVRGWDDASGVRRRQKLLAYDTEKKLCHALVQTNNILQIPKSYYPRTKPIFEKEDGTTEGGWWYRPTEVVNCKKCIGCYNLRAEDEFDLKQWQSKSGSCCNECKGKDDVKRRKTTDKPSRRSGRNKDKVMNYTESRDDEMLEEDAEDVTKIWTGVRCEMADPRYIGVGEEADRGDVILTAWVAKEVVQRETELPQGVAELWMTTGQMGYSLEREETELVDERDDAEGKETARFLAPEISNFIRRQLWTELGGDGTEMDKNETLEAAWLLDQVWGRWEENTHDGREGTGVQQECEDPSDIRYHGESTAWYKTQQWESPSTPLAAFDPEPIPDYGQRVEVGRDLLLDELPARTEGKGYVSVAESSFVWKEGEGLGIKTFEGLTTCFEAGRSWTIMSGIWNHLKQRWTGSKEELTKLIWEEKVHQGRLEDQGYRSPTWKMLEALKAINGATRLYGESAITAAPMFEHAGREGQVYWGDKGAKGPMVVLWDSLTDEGKKECLEELRTTKDWVIWRKDNRNGDESLMAYLMEAGREEFRGRAARGQEEQKGMSGEETTLRGRAQKGRGWWRRGDAGAYLNGNGMKCWVHKDMDEMRDKVKQGVQEAWDDVTEKDTCTINLTGPERDFWLGSEAGMLGCYWFRGVVFAGDGSDHKGRMGAGCFCLGDPDMKQCVGVGREEEGTSSNRPELAALVLALRATKTTDDMIYLCDNQALLKAVQKWTGEGPKATMVNAPDADILREIIELLRARVNSGAATFLIKVKAHRGEPLNELADTLAEEAREAAKENREWIARTDRMVYQWQQDESARRSVWTAGVRKSVRKEAGQFIVRSTREKATRRWRELHFERSCQARPGMRMCPQEWMQPTEEGLMELRCGVRSGDIMSSERWSERCDEAIKQGDSGSPSTTTWSAGFLLRKGQSREALGKWLTNRAVPWKRRRRTLQVITGTFPCGKWLHKIGKRPTSECERCRKAWTAAGKTGAVPDETVGHIQSVQCVSQEEVVTAAHNRCWREIMEGITKYGSEKRSIKILECEKEKTLRTLWREEMLDEFFPREELADEMRKIHEEHREAKQKAQEDSDMGKAGDMAEEEEEFSEEGAIWARKLDGAAIDEKEKILYVLEFKRTTDQREEYEVRAKARAERQYEGLVQGLLRVGRKQDQGWTAKQITFVGGTCGSVNVASFEENLKELQVLESKWGKMRSEFARKLLEEQDTVFRRYYEAKWGNGDGGMGRANAGGREHVGRDVYMVVGRE
jgi:ribonuclease HI